jgi:hypothetical protein
MRRRTRKLKETAIESLTLAVEVFNRPSPTARTQGVLLNLQHAFEMLFKAVIWEDRKRIQPPGSGKSYSFKRCLGILGSMGLLNEDEKVTAATIDAHRDGVQHQGADVTEERLYVDAMSALRLFDELLHRAFGERLAANPMFAGRMLPIAANPPRELHVLTGSDVERVRELLQPSKHRRAEAYAFLRTLLVSERAANDPMADVEQPTEGQLDRVARQLQKTDDWTKVFPGLARLSLTEDEDVVYKLRIVKRGEEAAPVRVVKPGEPGAEDAASLLKVALHEQYPFGLKALAEKADLNQYEARAVVHLLRLKGRDDTYKEFRIDKVSFAHYSQQALREVREAVKAGRLQEARVAYSEYQRSRRKPRAASEPGRRHGTRARRARIPERCRAEAWDCPALAHEPRPRGAAAARRNAAPGPRRLACDVRRLERRRARPGA